MRAWLKRNRWGLLALPLLVLALPLPQIDRYYNVFVAAPYRVAVEAPPGEQVSYGGGRMWLVSAQPFRPVDHFGDPVSVPAGFTFIHAVVGFKVDTGDALSACSIFLEDSLGRRHGPGPVALTRTPYRSDTCMDLEGRSLTFQADLYFLLPPGADPAAIRIELDRERPRFVRLLAR